MARWKRENWRILCYSLPIRSTTFTTRGKLPRSSPTAASSIGLRSTAFSGRSRLTRKVSSPIENSITKELPLGLFLYAQAGGRILRRSDGDVIGKVVGDSGIGRRGGAAF